MIELSKVYTREYSLNAFWCWDEGERIELNAFLGTHLQNVLFWREGKTNKVSVWYELEEYKQWEKTIEQHIRNDSNWFEEAAKKFWETWNPILPFVKKERVIRTSGDMLEDYYNWRRFWPHMSVMMIVPDISTIPEKIRSEAIRLREETQDYSDVGDEVYIEWFQQAAPKYAHLVNVVTPEEGAQLGEGKIPSRLHQIEERLNGWALWRGKLYSTSQLVDVLRQDGFVLGKEEKINATHHRLRGVTACKGKESIVQGPVRLIARKGHFSSFREGEILVTEFTSPDFVPIMKKSSAIITEEGGLGSHAAIVSREMNKPCIVGTANATRLLKNGDIVEVDAVNGTVRILKRA
jgi:phosphoenolpyruvate synthase/pyruvate phosphate dikinase